MTEIRALLVDDEPLVRRGLRSSLAAFPDVEIVGECRTGREAVAAVRAERPDLLFLDVQMPELDGLGVLEELGDDRPPAIVFVTAYDAYALRAFEVHAVDYLLKPFDDARLRLALERARARLDAHRAAGGARGEHDRRLDALLEELRRRDRYLDRLTVRTGARVILVDVAEIDWIEAADNYVRVYAGGGRHVIRETIKNLEARLDPRRFVRIHRSAMVNLDQVRELRGLGDGEYAVYLRNGTQLTLSRTYREQFERRLGRPL